MSRECAMKEDVMVQVASLLDDAVVVYHEKLAC